MKKEWSIKEYWERLDKIASLKFMEFVYFHHHELMNLNNLQSQVIILGAK